MMKSRMEEKDSRFKELVLSTPLYTLSARSADSTLEEPSLLHLVVVDLAVAARRGGSLAWNVGTDEGRRERWTKRIVREAKERRIPTDHTSILHTPA
jgi:hypothetical protein